MSRYLFFVNQPYSYAILRPLQEEIQRRGDEVAWFLAGCTAAPLRSDDTRLCSVAEVSEYGPKAVFVPGDWVPDFLPGIKVEVFHGLARNKRGHRSEDQSDHYRIRGWFDLYCTHAEKDTAKFRELAAAHGFFAVRQTGWPKLDPLFSASMGAQGAAVSAHDQRPTVFFASTFSHSVTCAPVVADTVEQLVRSGRWRFIVTLHPKMDEATVKRYRGMAGDNLIFVESHEDLLPVMFNSDVMLCDTSSIMFEFMFLGKPVVTFRTKMPGPYLIDVHRQEDIEGALERALERPSEMMSAVRSLCDDLHPFRDGESSGRILDAVDAYIEDDQPRMKPKPINLWRKFKVRRRLRKELARQAELDAQL